MRDFLPLYELDKLICSLRAGDVLKAFDDRLVLRRNGKLTRIA